jgi:very-short-patch-repair endonuclease
MPLGGWPIADLSDRQHGVVAQRQLLELGYSEDQVRQRLATAELHRIHKGVYAVGRRTLTRKGHWIAAVLAYGEGAALSHRSAAALWEIRPTSQTAVDVTVPGTSRKRRARIRVHRARALEPGDLASVEGIPVTSVSRTLLDIAGVLDRDQLLRAVEQAERLQLFDLRAVDRALARAPSRKGTLAVRSVLADYREPPDTRSDLERRFFDLVDRAGLPRPQANVFVAGQLVDFFWPQFRLVVELDSKGYHRSPRAFETDRVRDAILQRHRCRVLRITDKRIKHEPRQVLEDVTALARLAA